MITCLQNQPNNQTKSRKKKLEDTDFNTVDYDMDEKYKYDNNK